MSHTCIYTKTRKNQAYPDLLGQERVEVDDPLLRDLAEFRLTLVANGYEAIPVAGKGVLNKGWTTGQITPARVIEETRCCPTMLNTGIRCGPAVGVDNDLADPLFAEAVDEIVEHILGPTPLKRRGSKGAMLVYYNRTPIKKQTISAADGTRLFEILGDGQQFVGYGRHPKGMDYRWLGSDPAMIPLTELPEVTAEQLYLLNTTIRDMLEEFGFVFKHEHRSSVNSAGASQPSPVTPHHHQQTTPDRDEDIPELCRAALAVIPNDMTREDWLAICFSIRHAGLDFGEWRDWCHRWQGGHNSEFEITKAWNSCNPRAITYRTLLKKADLADPTWRKTYRESKIRQRNQRYLDQMKGGPLSFI